MATPDEGPHPIQRLCVTDGRVFERKQLWPPPAHSRSQVSEIPCVVLAINYIGEDVDEGIPAHYEVLGKPIEGSAWAEKRKAVTAMVFIPAVTTVEYKEDLADVLKDSAKRVKEQREAQAQMDSVGDQETQPNTPQANGVPS